MKKGRKDGFEPWMKSQGPRACSYQWNVMGWERQPDSHTLGYILGETAEDMSQHRSANKPGRFVNCLWWFPRESRLEFPSWKRRICFTTSYPKQWKRNST